MKRDRKKVSVVVLLFIILIAITIGGLVWTITQGVRATGYTKAVATVTSCETQNIDGEQINVRVLVSYSDENGNLYQNASYIGDLNRCSVGMQMNIYYLNDGDRQYVYSKSSDMGFALIMLCGGAVCLVIAAVATVCLKKSGYFYRTPEV